MISNIKLCVELILCTLVTAADIPCSDKPSVSFQGFPQDTVVSRCKELFSDKHYVIQNVEFRYVENWSGSTVCHTVHV